MGQIYSRFVSVTKLETRQKKDGSGTYEYADATLQLYDLQGKPSTHQTFDWRTGEPKAPAADIIRYDAIREQAVELDRMNLQPNEIVIADIMTEITRYGRNEITVRSLMRQQPTGPQANSPR